MGKEETSCVVVRAECDKTAWLGRSVPAIIQGEVVVRERYLGEMSFSAFILQKKVV